MLPTATATPGCAPRGLARRCVRVVLAALLAVLAAGPTLAEQGEPIWSAVRSSKALGLSLIAEGCERSPSFRVLVDRLRSTKLLVYVQPVSELPGIMIGSTELIGVNGDYRYLRVSVNVQAPRKKVIALIGHELQHALEIALAPEVVDRESLAAFYRRIGYESPDGFDTEAASSMGNTVLDELWRWRPEPTSPASAIRPVAPSRPSASITRD